MLAGAGFSASGDGSELADLWVKGNMYSLINAITVIMNMLISVYGDGAADKAFEYFSAAAYNMFRFMKLDTDEEFKELIKVPSYKFSVMCAGAEKKIEMSLADMVYDSRDSMNSGFTDKIKKEFPSAYGMFIDWLKREDASVNEYTGLK